MGFIAAIKSCFVKYATFGGRARRAEIWWFFLFSFIASIATSVLDDSLGTIVTLGSDDDTTPLGIVSCALSLALLLPSLAVGARRLHDRDKSGWLQLLMFVPLVGGIWLIVLYCLPGTRGDNRFGPDPLAPPAPSSPPGGEWPIASP